MEPRIPSEDEAREAIHKPFVAETNLEETDEWFKDHVGKDTSCICPDLALFEPVGSLERSVAIGAE